MKIGVKIGPATERGVKRVAEEAERVGFDSVWLSERVAIPLDKPHPYQPTVDPWIGLSFVAAATERVTMGTSVSQIALRPPVLMARELATLDRLSEGRLIVGAPRAGSRRSLGRRECRSRHGRATQRVHSPSAASVDGAQRALAG